LGIWLLVPGAVLFLQLVAVLAVSGGRAGRVLAVGLELVNLGLPWLIPAEHTLIRSLVALDAMFGLLRLVDVLMMGPLPMRARLWHAFGIIDTARCRRAPRALDVASIRRGVLYAIPAAAFGWICFVVAPTMTGPLRILTRWGAGLVFVYTVSEIGYATLTL
jgi:hypothetical protein